MKTFNSYKKALSYFKSIKKDEFKILGDIGIESRDLLMVYPSFENVVVARLHKATLPANSWGVVIFDNYYSF